MAKFGGNVRWLATAALLLAGAGVASEPSPASAASSLSISVSGNHLVNGSGQTIRLLGVDRSGTEYECLYGDKAADGPTSAGSAHKIAGWHTNAVRVPLNEDCWLGINGVDLGGAPYRKDIMRYVATLQAAGLYVILDLHWAAPDTQLANSQWPMADADHSPAFWTSVATTFNSNTGVLFDLFNEPYINSWPCWENGCQTTYDGDTYQTAGMQQLVDAVRSTGATTPLMLGGLGYSSDESQWQAYEPADPDHQLVVSFHTYNFSGCNDAICWNSTIAPLAQTVPVVTGEFGENDCADSYALSYMSWADSEGVSYLGWTWDSTGPPSNWSCANGPALITSYSGHPTAYGVGLKDHLAKLAKA